ncbi:MAG TPA: flagellar hook-associated protein FlgK, partial [Methylibium sp.]
MSGMISIGQSALFASYAALQTTSNNISNVNTPGYSRQQVDLETAGGQFTGAGFFGKGVQVASVTRSYNQFLTTQANVSQAQASADSARLTQLQQLESALPTGQAGIGYAAGDMLNALVDVGNNPQDPSARQVVLARAQDLVSRFNAASSQITALQAGTATDIKNNVATVNGLTAQVATLNQEIAKTQGLGQSPNDLLDQRDQLIAQINKYVQVTTIPASDGTVGLFVGGGQQLVLGTRALTLSTVADSYDPSQVRLAVNEPGGSQQVPTSALSGGAIAGLMRFQDHDLVDARNLVGQMAAALSGRVNAQQALGLTLGQPPSAGPPIFATGAPQVLPNTNNARAANGNFAASVSLTVSDPTQLQASDYELRSDPSNPGSYLLKRLSDGLTRQVSPGATVDGFTISVSSPPPGPNDRFLLQPVGGAASGMKTVLADPNGIAAASPVVATVGAANTGTASVASLSVTSPTINPA